MTSHLGTDDAARLADELAEVLAASADEHGIPGAAAAVVAGGALHVAAHGVTNAEHPLPVTASDTLFQVGSITKTVAAAAVMLLVEAGDLALDDLVVDRLPDLDPALVDVLDGVTVEHALSHQVGIDGDHLFVQRAADDLAALAGARRLFAPGEGFSYCNAGFSLVGEVVTAVSGQPFPAFVRRRLLQPLGMAVAGFRADDVITHRVAAPHLVVDGEAHVLRRAGWQPGWELGPLDLAAGGLIASAAHVAEWGRFQWTGTAADGTRLLPQAALVRPHEPVVQVDAREAVGLDWFVRDTDGVRTIGHGGVTVGYVSELVVVPEAEVAVVCLTNATNGGVVNQVVRRWALERCAGVVERDPEPAADAFPHRPAQVAGSYLHAFAVLDVAVGERPGTVVVTPRARDDVPGGWQPPPDPRVTYAFSGDRDAVSLDAPGPARTLRFADDVDGDGDGRPAWVLSGSRRAPRTA